MEKLETFNIVLDDHFDRARFGELNSDRTDELKSSSTISGLQVSKRV